MLIKKYFLLILFFVSANTTHGAGRSADIFKEPNSVQQAYTHLIIHFINTQVAPNNKNICNLAQVKTFCGWAVLHVNMELLTPLVYYARAQLDNQTFSDNVNKAQKRVIWHYKKFIAEKTPKGHERVTRATIQKSFHAMLWFMFYNMKTYTWTPMDLSQESKKDSNEDSSNFEDGACSCCAIS